LKPAAVIDASALLAYLFDEPGAMVVQQALAVCAAITAANWAETLSKASDYGHDPDRVADRMIADGFIGSALVIVAVDEPLAREMARLRRATRAWGLSLGDRACLALGSRLGLPVISADRQWKTLKLGIEVRLIR
jgi:PIN domain nuclease of toxin-antitoxin system